MFKISFVIFREFLEISVLLGIIYAAFKDKQNFRFYFILGIIQGVAASSGLAFVLPRLAQTIYSKSDDLLQLTLLSMTVVLISFTILNVQNYSKKLKTDLNNISQKIDAGKATMYNLSLMVFMSILREGTEIILYVYSIAAVEKINLINHILGFISGAIAGITVGMLVSYSLLKLSARYLFKVTSILLMLIAAGLTSQIARILISSGMVDVLGNPIWDTSDIISDYSFLGKILNNIFGYESKPSQLGVLMYLIPLAIVIGFKMIRKASHNLKIKI